MRIAIQNDVIIVAEPNEKYQVLKSLGFRYQKSDRTLRNDLTLQNLERLGKIISLPPSFVEVKNRLMQNQLIIDEMRKEPEPTPMFNYPVNVELFKHQIRAANMAMISFSQKSQHNGFGLLFEMGCGKTLTAIAIAGELYKQRKIEKLLIVAPSSVCAVWPNELENFAEFKFKAEVLLGEKKKRLQKIERLMYYTPEKNLKVAVINYESTHRDGIFQALQDWNPDMIIADESQRIKTHSAAQSKAMHALGDKARYKLILSGTPIQNNAVDIYSQYRFLDKKVFGANFFAFRNRYCQMGGFNKYQIIGYKHMNELIQKSHSIAYRVTKSECLDLPEKTFVNRYIALDPKDRKLYDQVRKASFAELENGETLTAQTVLIKLLRLRQITGGFFQADDSDKPEQVNTAKINALSDILDDYVIETGKKIVIFATFRAELDAIQKLVESKKIGFQRIDGSIPLDNRGDIVKDFQSNDETKVFIAQTRTAGLGITLHAASFAVFYSLDFNYADYAQACDRIHRIGQSEKCTYIHLMIEHSVDSKILNAIHKKDNIAKNVVDNWQSYFE